MNPKGNQVFLFVLFRKKTSQFHKKDPHVQKNKSQRQHICMYLFRKFEEPVKISNIKYQISNIKNTDIIHTIHDQKYIEVHLDGAFSLIFVCLQLDLKKANSVLL